MKFGVREICDVVLKRKSAGWFGNLYSDAGMPVMYFDTLKTSSLEGQATTVYAQGGKGNPRLVAWEGDRVVTFTMEDALISPESFSILSGAGLIDASDEQKIYVHTTGQVKIVDGKITLEKMPSAEGEMYLMVMNQEGAVDTFYVPMKINLDGNVSNVFDVKVITEAWLAKYIEDHKILIDKGVIKAPSIPSVDTETARWGEGSNKISNPLDNERVVYVDYYVESDKGVKQIDIEAGKFGENYYLEASTLFRDQATGADYPAEFVIPNCKVQSNFTFTMAPSGDPSTFTFTMDAFPDYTKFDKTKKVIAALQIIEDVDTFGAVATGNSGEVQG